jgi:hypothetical protein
MSNWYLYVLVFIFLLVIGLVGTAACGERRESGGARTPQEETAVTTFSIEEAQRQLTDSVMSIPGVVGIGIGECEGTPCIKVFIARKTAELVDRIPTIYKGYTVRVEETGEFQAFEDTAG